jgi:hypothetical protein
MIWDAAFEPMVSLGRKSAKDTEAIFCVDFLKLNSTISLKENRKEEEDNSFQNTSLDQ